MERGREEEEGGGRNREGKRGKDRGREKLRHRQTPRHHLSLCGGGVEGAKGVPDDNWLASCSNRQGERQVISTNSANGPLVAFFLLHQKAAHETLYIFSFQPG